METGVRRVAGPTASWGDGLMEGMGKHLPFPCPGHTHTEASWLSRSRKVLFTWLITFMMV